MVDKKAIRVDGVISEALPNAFFKVQLENSKEVLAHLAGKMRIHFIKVMVGDRVTIEVSPYDETRGRIVFRR